MSTLTPDQNGLANELQQLRGKVHELSSAVNDLTAKVKEPDEKDKEYEPYIRLSMTLIAQVGGFFMLWLLGSNTFSLDIAIQQPVIRDGLEYIQVIERVYMAGSGIIIILVLTLLWYFNKNFIEHRNVDIVLICFVVFDLALLLFLVCQEGGLCRSMFLPVYFLIPTAYLTAERHDKSYRKRKLFVLSLILLCIYISYRYAAWAQPPQSGSNLMPATGTFYLLWQWWPVNLSDFSTLAHRDYDEAVWYASFISAFVPIFQILSLAFVDKLKEAKRKAQGGVIPDAN